MVARLRSESKGGTVVCFVIRAAGTKILAVCDRFDLNSIVLINPLDRI